MNGELRGDQEEDDDRKMDETESFFKDFLDETSDPTNTKWKDVSSTFLQATKDLELGELLHDSDFGLFDAMSAIELMDPRMDAGMSCNRTENVPFTLQTAIETGHVKLDNITYKEKIGLIDETFACFVTWLGGQSSAQTVFTNLYCHKTEDIKDKHVRVFCIGILKLVDEIKNIIVKSAVFEDEDFQTSTFRFNLYSSMTKLEISTLLREVEDELYNAISVFKSSDDKIDEVPFIEALIVRTRFLNYLYCGFIGISQSEIEDGRNFFNRAKLQLDCIIATADLGLCPEDCPKGQMFGFEPLANQQLLSPTYPRYIKMESRKKSFDYLGKLIQRIDTALSSLKISSFNSLLEFFYEFSAGDTCVLSRSVLQMLFSSLRKLNTVPPTCALEGSSVSLNFQDLIKSSCKSFIAPPTLFFKNYSQQAQKEKNSLQNFFVRVSTIMCKLLQTYGHNKARQRGKIADVLDSFFTAQIEAQSLDNVFDSGNSDSTNMLYSTWLLNHVLRLMIRYILLGFDLELYSIHEYPYIFYYLHGILFPWLTTCLHKAEGNIVKQEQLSESQRMTGRNKKKPKSSSVSYEYEIKLYEGYTVLCDGYFKLMVGLARDKKINFPSGEFDKESIRYEHRFAPFGRVFSPPLISYSNYTEYYNEVFKSDSSEIFFMSSQDFAAARQIFYDLINLPSDSFASSASIPNLSEELNKLLAVSKTNLIVTSILVEDRKRNVVFLQSIHRTFPTPKFTS